MPAAVIHRAGRAGLRWSDPGAGAVAQPAQRSSSALIMSRGGSEDHWRLPDIWHAQRRWLARPDAAEGRSGHRAFVLPRAMPPPEACCRQSRGDRGVVRPSRMLGDFQQRSLLHERARIGGAGEDALACSSCAAGIMARLRDRRP